MGAIDYFETIVPLVKISSIRILLALCNNKDWIIHQMDVVFAFLHGDRHEEVDMHQPKGFIHNQGLVSKLLKALYGPKQYSRAWYQRIYSLSLKKGMKRVELDHSIYIFRTSEETIIKAIYVDDLLLVGNSIYIINDLKIILKKEYKMKKLGEARFR